MIDISTTHELNNRFFEGYYKEIWKQIFPQKTTLAEVDFLIQVANLSTHSFVLDLMCGYGRHALELARRSIRVTALDILPEYILELEKESSLQALPIEVLEIDVLKYQAENKYDAILCMGNSLQFFSQVEILKFFNTVNSHLKDNGIFFVNTWFLLEIVLKSFQSNSWNRYNNLLFLNESKWMFHPTRIETKSIIIPDNGEREEKESVDFIYSINEIEQLLQLNNLRIENIFSIPGKKHFTIGDPRAYLVIKKIKI